MTTPDLTVRPIPPEEHRAFVRRVSDGGRSVSFLQTPAWGQVKQEWRPESLGWFSATGGLVGVALVLYRQPPRVRRYLAYLPEGPVIDWEDAALERWLRPMTVHLRRRGAFGVRMGPPVVTARWSAESVKRGMADEEVVSLAQVPPSERSQAGARVVSELNELGWRLQTAESGFAAGQPQYNFHIPLADRTEDDVLRGMNQLWRRNIKKAAKAGVTVERPDDADVEKGLARFHDLYRHTAARDGFTPRPLPYFQTMFAALSAEDPDRIRLYLAHHETDLVAATVAVKVGRHVWYSYGASSTDKREVRGSNAVQWRMIQDALAEDAHVYDLRGITDTLAADDPHVGLVQFKVGTGGEAVQYAGEWDLPLRPLLYRAFAAYMRRRS